MVHAINTRTPSTDSKMGLSSSNAGFVAKALGQSIKNKAFVKRSHEQYHLCMFLKKHFKGIRRN
jgi:predicted N-acyltransferase